jgi:hypothetical protein
MRKFTPYSRRFLKAVQARAARVAITASATRGQRAPGIVERARDFCSGLNLRQFATQDRVVFNRRLDQQTARLLSVLPHGAHHWGLSRKLLNIFLRDALYTRYLAEHYQLAAAEFLFEVPLDSISGKACLRIGAGTVLPRWPGVKYLSSEVNGLYQAAIRTEARRKRIAPVHLDTFWWGERKARRPNSG